MSEPPTTSPPLRVVMQDGQIRPDGMVCVDPDDPGVIHGRSAFETFRCWNGTPFRLGAHLDRLGGSCRALGVPWPGAAVIRSEVARTLDAFGQRDAAVRVTLTAGGRRWVRVTAPPGPTTSVSCATRTAGGGARSLPGTVKHGSRAAGWAALRGTSVDELIWLSDDGSVLEGTWSSVFVVDGDTLRTPPLDGRVLPGVTRAALLSACRASGIPVVDDAPVHLHPGVSAVFLTSALRGVVPVHALDGAPLPTDHPRVAAASNAYFTVRDRECGLR